MANGHAALALVHDYDPEASTNAQPAEIAIGEAMAVACAAVGMGLLFGAETGKLDRTSVAWGGRMMTPVVEFALGYHGEDWAAVARRVVR
jgi:hypothetical protein